jgi:hypothetical protein
MSQFSVDEFISVDKASFKVVGGIYCIVNGCPGNRWEYLIKNETWEIFWLRSDGKIWTKWECKTEDVVKFQIECSPSVFKEGDSIQGFKIKEIKTWNILETFGETGDEQIFPKGTLKYWEGCKEKDIWCVKYDGYDFNFYRGSFVEVVGITKK